MSPFAIFGLIILFAVIIHCLNHRFFGIQTTIAITIGATILVLIMAILEPLLEIFKLVLVFLTHPALFAS